jgi:hypothetical protein
MPYASAGVRELWFGASSAAAVAGFGGGKAACGRREAALHSERHFSLAGPPADGGARAMA